MLDNNLNVFFELIKAGLWEKDVQLSRFGDIDLKKIYRIAEEQSVLGLIAAGLEHVSDVKLPKEEALQLVGQAIQLEQRNKAMNAFVERFIEDLRKAGIYTLLVKGQGIAKCYEHPLWRSCGDIDLFLSDENYEKAKSYLTPLASSVEPEAAFKKHLGLYIDGYLIELHGYLRGGLSFKVDKELDDIQYDTFHNGSIRSIFIGNTQVFLLSIENDIIYVFSHILDHFYKGGIGLRQVCDWSRLVWTYCETLNVRLLESRLRKMGLLTEWKAFGSFAVEYLGIPADVMPYYNSGQKWKRKAEKICSFVMEVGNFGHSRDNSYYNKPFIIRKTLSFGRRCGDLMRHARIFPMDSLRFIPCIMFNGLKAAFKGENND